MMRGLSQRELASLTGIPLGTLRRLERGEIANPGIRYIAVIARALELEDIELLVEYEWWQLR